MEIRETQEQIEHAHHREKNRAALLIVILAALLTITEIGAKEAQYSALAENIERSDLYAFYQAKTIRAEVLRAASEHAVLSTEQGHSDDLAKQLENWKQSIDTLDSDPKKLNGRKELLDKARAIEADRDEKIGTYHDFEFASAAMQLAIVLASAAVITNRAILEAIAVVFGMVGLGLSVLALLAPQALPL